MPSIGDRCWLERRSQVGANLRRGRGGRKPSDIGGSVAIMVRRAAAPAAVPVENIFLVRANDARTCNIAERHFWPSLQPAVITAGEMRPCSRISARCLCRYGSVRAGEASLPLVLSAWAKAPPARTWLRGMGAAKAERIGRAVA